MLKPARSSLEGQSVVGIIAVCAYLLYQVISSMNPNLPPAEDLLKHAQNAKDIAEAYQLSGDWVKESAGLLQSGAILTFLYKILTKFIDVRSDLKKTEMDVKAKLAAESKKP